MDLVEIRQRMLTKIAASGLDSADARKLGFKPFPVAPEGISIPGAGFTLPYFNIEGRQNGFFRYRYLEEIKFRGKLIRYSQPAGKSPEAYFSPLLDWKKYLETNQGENRVLFITEGELKADAACKFGLPVIGLGGVWNFKSKSSALIPGLKQIVWDQATIYIVYDSDAVSNFHVIQAENALARELLEAGGNLYIVRLPTLIEGSKTGLDDFLVAQGSELFTKVLQETAPWTESRQLHELNEEVVFVHDPGAVLEIASGQRMAPAVFSSSIYANRVWEAQGVGTGGKPKTVKKNAAVEWIKWPGRAEVRRTTYLPGQGRILDSREFNTWLGWGCEPVRGDVKPWHEFMDFFFLGAKPEDRRWFEQWLAYPLQVPGTKLFTAVVVHGAQGAGKTLAAYTMRRIYGPNFSEIDEDQLLGAFNEWAENKQFVMGDEIAGGDKRAFADRLKAIITRESIRINAKYIPTYNVPDRVNYYFTSNHPDSFYFEDDDRRYFVHEIMQPLPLDFAVRYDAWYNSPEGASALFYYLLHSVDTSTFNPKAPAPENAAKKRMIELGRSDAGAWVAALKESPEQILKMGDLPPIKFQLITTDTLFRVYEAANPNSKLTRPGLSRALRSGGFHQVNLGEPVRTKTSGTVRLWAVQGDRDKLRKATPLQITKLYEEEREGTKIAKKKEKF